MSALATKEFWVQAGERAVKTAAQFGVGMFALDVTGQIVFEATRWASIPIAMATGAVFSVLTSLASVAVSPEDNPSLVRTPPGPLPPPVAPRTSAPDVPPPPV